MNAMFVECYTREDKEKLISKGFTFLPEQSTDYKFTFFNNGTFDFSETDMKIKLHNIAKV